MADAPRYEHDCSNCTFLGQHNEYDLYYCPQVSGCPTVIARYSSDGPDYTSGLEAGRRGLVPELAEAVKRARSNGLLPDQ